MVALLLLIDNDDSFTQNLAQLLADESGEQPLVVNWRDVGRVADYAPDWVVLSPGPGEPRPELVALVREATVPLLGVCLGHQAIARAFGGRLARATPMHGRLSTLRHDGAGLFEGLPQGHRVVRYHSLAVRELPPELRATAWADDGEIMALAHRARPIWGVQYHPEALLSEHGRELVARFRTLAGRPRRVLSAVPPAPALSPLPLVTRRVARTDPEQLFAALFPDGPAFWLERPGYTVMGRLGREGLPERRGALPGLPFPGGACGYLEYEGRARFFEVERFVVLEAETATFVADDPAWIDAALATPLPELPAVPLTEASAEHRLARSEARYREDIAACLEHLRAGDSYELCLTNQVIVDGAVDAWRLWRALRRLSPAPHAGFLRTEDVTLVSSSPEQFLRIEDGVVTSKPIKGTAARGRTAEEDEAARIALATSEKTRSENMMIVDLVRNDLGAVCAPGTVAVPDLMTVESYASVHQLVSRITGRLRPDVTPMEAIAAAFPGGSMTGAPKKRSMELLAEREGAPRGIYSGAFGTIGFDGSVDLAMVIRTAVVTAERTTIGVGGAIVALSDPDDELEEMRLKARPILRAIACARMPVSSTAQ